MESLKAFVHRHPVRVTAFVSSFVALIITAVSPDIPTEPAVIFVLSALGLGEYAQRVEDKKTVEALYTEVEDIEEGEEE
jgi:hypothetical protein